MIRRDRDLGPTAGWGFRGSDHTILKDDIG